MKEKKLKKQNEKMKQLIQEIQNSGTIKILNDMLTVLNQILNELQIQRNIK